MLDFGKRITDDRTESGGTEMKTQKNEGEQQNKPVTRYDQKMEKRKKKAKEDARKDRIFNLTVLGIGVLFVAAILGLFATSAINKNKVIKDTYVKIGAYDITKLEYDYYYNMIVTNYLNTYSSILPYMGLDTSIDFAQQQYSDTQTWKDAFDEMTVNQLINVKAMTDDANANGFTAEVDADYSEFQTNMATSAASSGLSEAQYYKAYFGQYATKENLEPYIKNNLLVEAYYNSLVDRFGPSEEEIADYYNEHKNDYDKVSYRSFTFMADAAADEAGDTAENAAAEQTMEQLKATAEKMAERRKAGEEFNALCLEYAAEGDKEKYQAADSDASLMKDDSYAYASAYYRDWLFDENRKAEEITVVEDESLGAVYVVEFIERTLDETANETIKLTLADEVVSEYIDSLMAAYEVVDVAGELVYLTIPETVEETVTTEESVGETAETEAGETEVTAEATTAAAETQVNETTVTDESAETETSADETTAAE